LKISLIIPAFREEARIGKSLEIITDYFDKQEYEWEIIVVDDGSGDATVGICKKYEDVKILEQKKNMGKGAAVRWGMLEASGDFCVFSDADLSTPIYEIEKLIKEFQNGFEVCIGSRALVSEMIKEHQPWYRESMGKFFNKLVQMLVFKGISDTQCGFKGFSAKSAQEIFSKTKIDGFAFDVEVLFLANKLNYKIKEIAVEWFNDERSTVNPITDSAKMFLEILRIRRLHS
jgi:dolichyl-phosphate beta-glucosyltransferase